MRPRRRITILHRLGTLALVLLLAAFAAAVAAANEGERRVATDIERFLRARMAASEGEVGRVAIDLPPLTGFAVDRERFPGTLRTEISTRAPEPFRGRAPLAVALYADDLLVKRSVVTPYVRRIEQVVVPTRDLRRGDRVDPGDFRVVDRDATRIPRNAVRDPSELVGLRAKQSLRKDRPVRSNQLEGVPVVERGDRVQLILRAGALQINATGRAQEKGAVGDWIRVVNVDSKRELSGRVDREGRVHVAF